MKIRLRALLATLVLIAASGRADELLFQDDFNGKLGKGWSWIREHRAYWRIADHGLEVRIEPGNMWGPANDAKNVLVRRAPDATKDEIEVSVNVQTNPTEQYEQADLVWYFDDGHMVKIGRELVDGKISVVMGREENDRTRTIAIIPLNIPTVSLRLQVKDNQVRGWFRAPASKKWRKAGECDLPAPPHGKAKIALQFYQGPVNAEHWARVTEFRILRIGK